MARPNYPDRQLRRFPMDRSRFREDVAVERFLAKFPQHQAAPPEPHCNHCGQAHPTRRCPLLPRGGYRA